MILKLTRCARFGIDEAARVCGQTMPVKVREAFKRFGDDTSGAVLVEFAFVLPIFLIMLFAAVGWGITLTLNDAMYDAARQAARELAVGVSTETQARSSAETLLSIWGPNFTVVAQDVATTGSEDVRVQVTTPNVLAQALPFIPLPDDLSAVVVMRKEGI